MAKLDDSGSGLVAGMATCTQDNQIQLADHTGTITLAPHIVDQLESLPAWVALMLDTNHGQTLHFQQPIRQPIRPMVDQPKVLLQKRWQIHASLRKFFTSRYFTEVDTPISVTCPGMEPYLDSFAVADRYLRTSPELHMKRLLAAGMEPIFQMAVCFRAGDHGSQHRQEFLLLEWYRLFADLDAIADDVGQLLSTLAIFAENSDYFRQQPDQITCYELFQRYAGINLTDHHRTEPLVKACRRLHIHYNKGDDWDTLFFRIFLQVIQPHLGMERPILVTAYPASQKALSKCAPPQPGQLPTCYRFELFIKGIEIANAFYELTDVKEQRQRFEADSRERIQLDKPVYAIDEAFLAGLEAGLPPAAGIALGVDRLVLALLNLTDFDQLLPFS